MTTAEAMRWGVLGMVGVSLAERMTGLGGIEGSVVGSMAGSVMLAAAVEE